MIGMNPDLPSVVPALVETEIVERAAAARLRLRFDRVAVRLRDSVKAKLANTVPEDQTVVIAVTAPVRLPARTAESLESLVLSGLPGGELHTIVHGNRILLRRVCGVAPGMPGVLVFVHNPASGAADILELAEARLRAQPDRRK
jgi:hypothetical protein